MYIRINPNSQQKHPPQGMFLAQSPLEKFRIILLFTIVYINSRLVPTSLFSTISTTLNVIRDITLHLRGSNTSIVWKQEKLCS